MHSCGVDQNPFSSSRAQANFFKIKQIISFAQLSIIKSSSNLFLPGFLVQIYNQSNLDLKGLNEFSSSASCAEQGQLQGQSRLFRAFSWLLKFKSPRMETTHSLARLLHFPQVNFLLCPHLTCCDSYPSARHCCEDTTSTETSTQVWAGYCEVTLKLSLFQAERNPLPPAVFAGQMLQPLITLEFLCWNGFSKLKSFLCWGIQNKALSKCVLMSAE